MSKFFLLFLGCLITLHSFGGTQNDTLIKARKLSYNDFMAQYSFNDTSATIIEIFFNKKEDLAYGEMVFLPVTMALFLVSPTLSIATTAISLPLFLHGTVILIKYRKKRLLNILTNYRKTGYLPKRLKKKTIKKINFYKEAPLS